MKRALIFLALLPLICVSCTLTRIVTVSPDDGIYSNNHATYTTRVVTPKTNMVTSTTRVVAADNDIALSLDLQAVGAAFAQSETVEEFEDLLNNSSYMLSNLDLNRDGYVDYLRVLETVEGYNHVILIQAVLAEDIYQDVATIVTQATQVNPYIEVIGDPYIYGPNYIVRPVFVTTPLIYAHLLHVTAYRIWRSPWHWNHFPPHYRHPAPIYHGHYHAYINTFMRNHRYCHEVHYPSVCFFPDYKRVCQTNQRQDYAKQFPERTFTTRNANLVARNYDNPEQMSTRQANARDLNAVQELSTKTRVTTNSRQTSGAGTTNATRSTATTGSRSTGTATAGRSTTTTGSRSTATGTTTTGRSTATTGTRSTGTATTGRSTTTTGSRSTGTSSTTVRSNVRSSGSANTRISTEKNGTTSTVRRGSSTGSSTRSTGATGSSRSTGTGTASTGRSTTTSRSTATTGSRGASSSRR